MSQRTDRLLALAIMVATAGAACAIGWGVTHRVEARTEGRIATLMAAAGLDWARIGIDGTRVTLRGEAPDERAALAALDAVLQASAWAVAIDRMDIAPAPPEVAAPLPVEPAITIWRDDDGLAITGQAPDGETRHALTAALASASGTEDITDLASDAGQPVPAGWPVLAGEAAEIAAALDHGAVMLRPGHLVIEGLPAGLVARDQIRRSAQRLQEAGITVHVDLVEAAAAARPPYSFAATLDDEQASILLCTAPDQETGEAVAALASTMLDAPHAPCRIDPDPPADGWMAAVRSGLIALTELGSGRFELEATEARLVPAPDALGAAFEAATARLEAALPPAYTLVAAPDVIADPAPAASPEAWLRARRSAERVWLMGAAPDEATLQAVTAYADAMFGTATVDSVMTAADSALPEGWRAAALAALDALAPLQRGEAVVGDGQVRIWGGALDPAAARSTHQALAGLAERGWRGTSRITVDLPALIASMELGPETCAAELKRRVEATPILFDPGEATIDASSKSLLDDLAATLRRCGPMAIEIGGHTDSQGSVDYNRRLSAARAAEVRAALVERGVGKVRLTTHGYGPAQPVDDNATEAGRALNRRIAFTVVPETPAPPPARDETAETDGALVLTGTPPPLVVPVPRP